MVSPQVITVTPDGEVSALRVKKGSGLDLRSLGSTVEVERVSEILWEEVAQKWFVKFVAGPMAGKFIVKPGSTATCYFDEYEDAVEAEIAVLNYVRLQGVL